MEKNICDVFVLVSFFFNFNFIWSKFYFQITIDVILVHIWILEYHILGFYF
jgi:hypothetical protein